MPLRTAIHEDNDHTPEAVLAAYSGDGGRMQVSATISSDEDYDWLAVELDEMLNASITQRQILLSSFL
jgi:hypothetical protein